MKNKDIVSNCEVFVKTVPICRREKVLFTFVNNITMADQFIMTKTNTISKIWTFPSKIE